jgi:hypothetical protein
MNRDDVDLFHMAASLAACLIGTGLYAWMGFFGVGLLGLLILYVAINVDLEGGRSLGGGGRNAALFARQIAIEDGSSRSERAGMNNERRERQRSTDYAMMVGFAFLTIGGAGFVFFQLRLGQ